LHGWRKKLGTHESALAVPGNKLNHMIPIGKNIIIKSIDQEIETESGLLLSAQDNNQLRYKKGLVIKSGTDVSVIKDGDTIYYDKHAGHTMMLNDQQYTLILERDVVIVGE